MGAHQHEAQAVVRDRIRLQKRFGRGVVFARKKRPDRWVIGQPLNDPLVPRRLHQLAVVDRIHVGLLDRVVDHHVATDLVQRHLRRAGVHAVGIVAGGDFVGFRGFLGWRRRRIWRRPSLKVL